jgi:hypothetical protein
MEGGRTLGGPDRPDRRAQRLPASVPTLGAVQHRVRGEQRDVAVGVLAAGRLVRAGDDLQDGQAVGGGQAHEPGRSHAAIRSRMSAGKMLLGMTACTALGGIDVYADPVWWAYCVTRKLTAMLASA